VRVDTDGAKIELVGRTKNANGNFAAIRSQQSLDGSQFRSGATGLWTLLHKREYCSASRLTDHTRKLDGS
jgi:hypothetical protein